MKILALDTTTEACSAALLSEGNVIKRFEIAPRKHTEILLPMVDEILAEANCSPTDLEGIAFSRGPGAFTGVRIAAGVVQGMALGLDCPVVAISSLEALALGVWRETGEQNVISAIDARMDEIYWAGYQISEGLSQIKIEEQLVSPEVAPAPFAEDVIIAGTGWTAYQDRLKSRDEFANVRGKGDCYPDAQDVLTLAVEKFEQGETISVDQISPIYLRDKVI